jgi:hypothetical protein
MPRRYHSRGMAPSQRSDPQGRAAGIASSRCYERFSPLAGRAAVDVGLKGGRCPRVEHYFGGFLMNRARRKRSADQSSSTATWRTVSNPDSRRTFQPLSRLNSQVYCFDVPFG